VVFLFFCLSFLLSFYWDFWGGFHTIAFERRNPAEVKADEGGNDWEAFRSKNLLL